MTENKKSHLREDQLLQAVVDEEALPLSTRDHLSTCLECRAEKERFSEDLAQLGQMASRFAPSPSKRVSFDEERPGFHLGWFWDRRAYLGTATAAVLVAVVLWSSGLFTKVPEEGLDMMAEETWEAEQFMAEISTLVENALPPEYLELSGEFDSSFDETFMEFVVPSTETDPLSHDTHDRGKGGTDHVKA